MREQYRALCRDTKLAVKKDWIDLLEKEAGDLADAFTENTFKGYSLLKRQHRTRSKPVMPTVSEFSEHYRAHYQLGTEVPIEVAGCAPPPSLDDDTLTREEFDAGVHRLNANRSPGHDGCAPEYVKHGGPILLQWLFVLAVRIWTFISDLPAIDRIGCLIPIPKKAGGTSVALFRPICLLTTVYKLFAILVFQKVRDRVKEFVFWTQTGFIHGRSCGNNLWILRRVAERAIEFNIPIYCALVDYKGAFDALNHTTIFSCSCHLQWFVGC